MIPIARDVNHLVQSFPRYSAYLQFQQSLVIRTLACFYRRVPVLSCQESGYTVPLFTFADLPSLCTAQFSLV